MDKCRNAAHGNFYDRTQRVAHIVEIIAAADIAGTAAAKRASRRGAHLHNQLHHHVVGENQHARKTFTR